LALKTWVSGPGSLVAGGHGLCGRFRHRKSLWPVSPQKKLPERRRTDGRTHTQFVIILLIYVLGYLLLEEPCIEISDDFSFLFFGRIFLAIENLKCFLFLIYIFGYIYTYIAREKMPMIFTHKHSLSLSLCKTHTLFFLGFLVNFCDIAKLVMINRKI
jgi:hypothetical protein